MLVRRDDVTTETAADERLEALDELFVGARMVEGDDRAVLNVMQPPLRRKVFVLAEGRPSANSEVKIVARLSLNSLNCLTGAGEDRELGSFARKLSSRSCTYELACKTLALRRLFVLARRHSSVCTSIRGTCNAENDRNASDQSHC